MCSVLVLVDLYYHELVWPVYVILVLMKGLVLLLLQTIPLSSMEGGI